MDRLPMNCRLPITLVSLALLALPLGCGSDTTNTVEVPTAPTVTVTPGTPTVSMTPETPTPSPTEPSTKFDSAVNQTVGDMKRDAEADVKAAEKNVYRTEGRIGKAVEESEDEAKRKTQELEAKARRSAEAALEKLLPEPK